MTVRNVIKGTGGCTPKPRGTPKPTIPDIVLPTKEMIKYLDLTSSGENLSKLVINKTPIEHSTSTLQKNM